MAAVADALGEHDTRLRGGPLCRSAHAKNSWAKVEPFRLTRPAFGGVIAT